jgi:hypothetical protein
MYLVEISQRTGLIKEDPLLDGFMAIQSFRKVVETLGLEAMTVIAIACDYQSPLRYYTMKDRPYAAMKFVTGSKSSFIWEQDIVQEAMNDYLDLQKDQILEEGVLLRDLKESQLIKIKNEKDTEKQTSLFKEMGAINDLIKKYDRDNKEKDIFASSPVVNGYKLSRLENKITDKNSFYYDKNQNKPRSN